MKNNRNMLLGYAGYVFILIVLIGTADSMFTLGEIQRGHLNPATWTHISLWTGMFFIVTPAMLMLLAVAGSGDSKRVLQQQNEYLQGQLNRSYANHRRTIEQLATAHLAREQYDRAMAALETVNANVTALEARCAEAEKEVEFWRTKDNVSAAADVYYTLCQDYRDECDKHGGLTQFVDHLYDLAKSREGLKELDNE